MDQIELRRQKMETIFIEIKGKGMPIYKVDIKDATAQERFDWYRGLTKGMVIQLLEKVGKFKS